MNYDELTRDKLLALAQARPSLEVKPSWGKQKLINALVADDDARVAADPAEGASGTDQPGTVLGVVEPPGSEGSDDDQAPPDDPEMRAELVSRAVGLGIHVPDDWGIDRIREVLDAIGDAVVADPRRPRKSSPRG